MGEYWITHVKEKTPDGNEIKQVRALMNTVEGLKNPVNYNKSQITESIQKGDKWYTCILKEIKDTKNLWKKDSEVHIVELDGEKFIRIDENQEKQDNLGQIADYENKK